MIVPSPSTAFIIEDKKEETSASGIVLNHQNKGKSSHGTIYAINLTTVCPHCIQAFDRKDLKEGDKVIYSRYVAEQIEHNEGDLKDKRVFAVPLDSILAKIC